MGLKSFIHSFIHSFIKYLWNYASDIFQAIGDTIKKMEQDPGLKIS